MFSHSTHSRRVPHDILLKSCFAHSSADIHISLLSNHFRPPVLVFVTLTMPFPLGSDVTVTMTRRGRTTANWKVFGGGQSASWHFKCQRPRAKHSPDLLHTVIKGIIISSLSCFITSQNQTEGRRAAESHAGQFRQGGGLLKTHYTPPVGPG